jgi:probable addiction module antidote protein
MSDYKDDLFEDLKDPPYAAQYLSAAYADSAEAFLVALRDVADVYVGMKKLATRAGINRENLYRMLSEGGNPRLASLRAVLETLGMGVDFRASPTPQHRRSKSGIRRTGKMRRLRGRATRG